MKSMSENRDRHESWIVCVCVCESTIEFGFLWKQNKNLYLLLEIRAQSSQ